MNATSIEWTDRSWNPLRYREKATGKVVWHCERVSDGCTNCYAEALAKRFNRGGRFARQDRALYEPFLDDKVLQQPLSLKKPSRIFVADMTDLFGEWVHDNMTDQVFAVMALCPQHTFQVLTKRPERMREYVKGLDFKRLALATLEIPGDWEGGLHSLMPWPLPNVWAGVSVEDQKTADERIPLLLQTPAAIRWVSYEPALGPVDFCFDYSEGAPTDHEPLRERNWLLHWIVVGGESGPNARPFNLQWARDTIRQCRESQVPVFVKQLGSNPRFNPIPDGPLRVWNMGIKFQNRKGGDIEEWPEDLRIRQFPGDVAG